MKTAFKVRLEPGDKQTQEASLREHRNGMVVAFTNTDPSAAT